jgi:hypothetical protein
LNSTITLDSEQWISVESEQNCYLRRPLFSLANRFRVHTLRITENYSGHAVKSYLILGLEPKEKLIVYYLFHKNGRVQKRKVLLNKGFDRELGRLLGLALNKKLGH